MTPPSSKRPYFISQGVKDRARLIQFLPGPEVSAPSEGSINITSRSERKHFTNKYPKLKFHNRSILKNLEPGTVTKPRVFKTSPGTTPGGLFKNAISSSMSRFNVFISRSDAAKKQTQGQEDEGELDNPFNPINKRVEEEVEENTPEESYQDAQRDEFSSPSKRVSRKRNSIQKTSGNSSFKLSNRDEVRRYLEETRRTSDDDVPNREQSPPQKDDTPKESPSPKRRRLAAEMLDNDDGFNSDISDDDDIPGPLFLQSDTENNGDSDSENENENRVVVAQPKEEEESVVIEQTEEEPAVVEQSEEPTVVERTAGDEFADEFDDDVVHEALIRRQGSDEPRRRARFNPTKDKLILETIETARKLAIPVKAVFEALEKMIGHTWYSHQTRHRLLESTPALSETARNAPDGNVTVSDVIASIVNKKKSSLRRRIPYTELDDLSLKSYVADLDPASRGGYLAYEPFAEKYLHHDVSSVKGRWTKTLAPRTSEIELLEAKEQYTPVVERQHMEWLAKTYPGMFGDL